MIDIITHGSPCQDFSVAGKGAGGEVGQGTRSSLMHTTVDIVAEVMPKYVVWENVKNVLSAKHRTAFDAYLEALRELGYNSYWKVLNSKNYGVPQNRERIFCISIRKDVDPYQGLDGLFPWPEPFDNGIRLKHLLESQVDEKYYLSEEKTAKLVAQFKPKDSQSIPIRFLDRNQKNLPDGYAMCVDTSNTNGVAVEEAKIITVGQTSSEGSQAGKVFHPYGLFPTVCACTHGYAIGHISEGVPIKEATKQGYAIAQPYDGVNIGMPNSETRRGRVGVGGYAHTLQTACDQGVLEPNECQMLGRIDIKGMDCVKRVYSQDGISPALTTMGGGHREPKTMQNFRIRKLTPLECWRLQAFSDEDFQKAKVAGISDSQLYKQAGNSITVDVLYHIFRNMFQPGDKLTLLDLFAGIGAFHKGLEKAGVEVDLFAYCEIDKYASKSYSVIHGVPESLNLWDVTKILENNLLKTERNES